MKVNKRIKPKMRANTYTKLVWTQSKDAQQMQATP